MSTSTADSIRSAAPRGAVRWRIALLLGLGVVISYFDRVNISVATEPLKAAYHLDDTRIGILLSSYLWSYTLMQVPVGALLDRFGVKWPLRFGIVLWALATMMTAAVSGLGLLIVSRIILGVAESPAFPGAAKAVGSWFPRQERSLATSAFDAAAKFSNVIGVPLVAWIVTGWGWRAGFWFTGVLTLAYGALFWALYREPAEARNLSVEEAQYIRAGGGAGSPGGAGHLDRSGDASERATAPLPAIEVGPALGFLLTQRKIWGLSLGFAAYGYAFYMLISWLPGYLAKEFHMSMLTSGMYTVIPWAVATVTDVVIGGWLVDRLIAQGRDETRVRKGMMSLGMLLGLAVIGAAYTSDPRVAVFWISIALGGLAFAAPIGWSIPGLVAPPGTTGMVGAIMNFCNNLFGIAAPILTGYIATRTGSFREAFVVAALVLAVGIACYVVLLGRIEQIRAPARIYRHP